MTLLSHKGGPVSWNRSDARIVTHRIQLNVRKRESEGDSSDVFIMSMCVCVWLIFYYYYYYYYYYYLVPVDGKRRASLSSQRIPLLLECGHSFCSHCIQKMSHLQSSDLPCPQCRVRREREGGRGGREEERGKEKERERER